MILVGNLLPFYIKSKDPWMCTVYAHLYSIFGLEIDAIHSLNFVKNLEEKIFPEMQPKQYHSMKFL